MAGSLKTAFYNLVKYAANDITSWLTDFNGNMDKIDTALNQNKTAAQTAQDGVDNLNGEYDSLLTVVNGHTTTIEANEKAIAANTGEIENLKNTISISAQVYKDDTLDDVTSVQENVTGLQVAGRNVGGFFEGTIVINVTAGELALYNRQANISGSNQYITDLFRITGNPFSLTAGVWTRTAGMAGGWFGNQANYLAKSDVVIGYVEDSGYTVIGYISNSASKISLSGNFTCQTMSA